MKKLLISLTLVLLTMVSQAQVRLSGNSESTKAAIAAHRQCSARELDSLLSAATQGSPYDLAVLAEKACIKEREALREALEAENSAANNQSAQNKAMIAGYADSATRLMREKLIKDLVMAQPRP